MKNRSRPVVLSLFLALAGSAFSPGRSQEAKKRELTHQISVSAVSIAVTVQDRAGRYINDLAEKDFKVYENGSPCPITYFQHDFEAPVSLTVLLDVSGSMAVGNKLEESKTMLRSLLTSLLNPRDEASLLIFADGEVEVAAGFATDRGAILAELDNVEAYGQTALNDAVAVSPEFAQKGRNEKRALLLITDGVENDSRATPDQALAIARRVDIPIYIIGYKIPLSEEYLRKHKRAASLTPTSIIDTLERFSLATGGKPFMIDEPGAMMAAATEIRRELSHQYILGYTSYKSEGNEYRKITVETAQKKYRVRTRAGY
jgi:Ca-activated chloride channel family protein